MSKYIKMYEGFFDKPEYEYPGGEEKVLDCDIAIVGGGGSGCAAAVRAAQLGAKVAVIEKMEVPGGNSRLAGGLLSTYSKFQKDLGMPDKTDDYIKTAYRHNKYTLDPSIFRRYISNTGTFLEWITELGFDISNTRWALDAVCMVKDRPEPGPWNNPAYGPGLMGSGCVNVLTEQMKSLSVELRMKTKARKILTDDNGNICGLIADGQDCTWRVYAKAVIIAAGGFAGNVKMLEEQFPHYFTSDNYVSHYSLSSMTGDGILMAGELGAELFQNMSIGTRGTVHIPGSYTMQRVVTEPVGTIVNKKGVRFIAEDDLNSCESVMDMQPEGMAYYILDNDGMEEAYQLIVDHVRFGDRIPTRDEFDNDIIEEVKNGTVCKADTLKALAAYIGCDEAALEATVSACNARFESGKDDEFFKASEHLRLIKKAPYYALPLHRHFDVTMGGISVNANTEALRPDGSVISGLYATGDNASGWMGTDYGPVFSSFAWAMNSGYIAGEEAANFVIG